MTTTATRQTLASYDPATGDLVGEVPVTSVDDIPAVVARARAALDGWRNLSAEERCAKIGAAGPRFLERADELGRLLTREMGKPLAEGTGEVKSCGYGLEEEAREIAAALEPESLEDTRTRTTVYHDAFGVCAAISPWNFPIAMPHSLVLPALVAGNTVILKPSEETPLIAQAYVDILNEVLPDGVLQIVHGADTQGKALVESDVDLIAFTGSRETGKKILASASAGLKRVVLELGGKDPLVVLSDADVDAAARFAAINSFRNAGQVCVSTERIYVHSSIADRFRSALVAVAESLPVGNGIEDGVRVGPMVSSRQKQHVLRQVEDAVRRGAQVVYGGTAREGNFVDPTVLWNVDHEMDIMREETFGPVACVQTFETNDEAVGLANDTPFGLGATVFGGDEENALAVARRLDAGMIGVNKGCGGASGSPWVGAKQSGYGYHSSKEGHRQFTQVRIVSSPKK
ncbi:MAG: aldehyde dehydrogenase [Candidatus Eisenbacteria bacterium]|uniref:Aldehyde dehydrogenase n=1 Tax=Eiseniibacteriota bacterium TaxID=2212470 RepID=A0A956NH86_UNCEI|nr:aldehyde dehydrogenase [Candidatus Eisenbacteria bacterium]MCB9464527.1 aldehyde dehydrogenase [Candidatus Eisenbacteria bacterium]